MCKCACGCSNFLTIVGRGTRCRQCVIGGHARAAAPAPLDVLTAALSRIEDICKPMSFDMSGRAVWFEGGTPAGGGSRQRIWEIAHAAIAAAYAEETK